MRTHTKLLLAALTTALLLSSAAGTAMALRSLGVNETNLTANGRETFAGSNGINVICNLTLTATLNSSIEKRAGNRVGGLTGVRPVND